MDTLLSYFFFSFFFFSFFICKASCIHACSPSVCRESQPLVHFPFRLLGRQNFRCGYPGFNLFCNNRSQTVLILPSNKKNNIFVVKSIDYASQSIYISDPGGCLPQRMKTFSLSGSPFSASLTTFIFLNSTLSEWYKYFMNGGVLVPCLSSHNSRVLALNGSGVGELVPPSNRSWRVGFYGYYWSNMDAIGTADLDVELKWDLPSCRSCVLQGGNCGFLSNTGMDIGCFQYTQSSLPRSARYGVIFGVGIPGLLLFIGLACFMNRRTRNHNQQGPVRSESELITNTPTSGPTGLDGSTIESYSKIVVGESGRLPDPQHGTCPVCLSEYQPEDTLRTIPECNHYFHANCIDKWLRLNSSCPMCRNLLDESYGV